jgi:hypothetical protein
MDGDNHGYLQDDVNYDDLMNGGWPPPTPTDQYAFGQPHQAPQAQYTQYPNTQALYPQYDMSHQQQPPNAYANSPYTNQYLQPQPDIYGPPSYGIEPTLQNSASYHGPESSFHFAHHGAEAPTISPASLQYNSQAPVNHGAPVSTYEQPLSNFNQRPLDNSALYFNPAQSSNLQNTGSPSQYPTLNDGAAFQEFRQSPRPLDRNETLPLVAPEPAAAPPTRPKSFKSSVIQNPSIQAPPRLTRPELYANKNSSVRPRLAYAPFLAWEDQPIEVPPGIKS